MEQLLELLKQRPKDELHWLILELMISDKISFAELAQTHAQYLEMLKKHETEELVKLRSKVIGLWCDNKKNIGKNLISLMQEAKDNGWANITQEQIDKSKWQKQSNYGRL